MLSAINNDEEYKLNDPESARDSCGRRKEKAKPDAVSASVVQEDPVSLLGYLYMYRFGTFPAALRRELAF